MSYKVVELHNNSYKPITNTAWVRKIQKRCTRLASASDKAYQLLAHGRWFSPGTPASTSTKTGRHGIAEILLKLALNTINQIKLNQILDNANILFRLYSFIYFFVIDNFHISYFDYEIIHFTGVTVL